MTPHPDDSTTVLPQAVCSYCYGYGFIKVEIYDPKEKNALVGVTSITCPRCRGRKV